MGRYIINRILIAIPVLLGVTVLNFTFINLAPGDPIMAMIDPQTGPSGASLEALREQLGLNQPAPVRYVIWLREVVQGNLGYSYIHVRPVSERILERLGPTLVLTFSALFISVVIGIPLGLLSALKQYSFVDYILTIFGFAGLSVPNFFLAMGAIYLFSLRFDIFPAYGMITLGGDLHPTLDMVYHLIMPAFILGLSSAASLMRFARTSLLEVLGTEYITTARAKGLRERAVIYGHAFRNALLPLITVLGLRLPGLFGGSVIIETIFAWPGIGQLAITAINERDYPQIMGLLLITAVLVLLANLITDIVYAYADPRIRYE